MEMFTEKSFEIFTIAGVEPRMAAIRGEIQPIFQQLGEDFKEYLEKELAEPFFVHIAQHRRRTTHAPDSTWMALSPNKRGYKMAPHFQLGIWDSYVFMWLSCIDQPKNQRWFAEKMLEQLDFFDQLPESFVLSGDHTQKTVHACAKAQAEKLLIRLRDVKKGEFQIGRILPRTSEYWQEPQKAQAYMLETYQHLLPLYQILNEKERTK